MAGKPQKRTERTRERILEAARELFEEHGYEATSVDAVAARAGVAKATVFAHFSDKASLLIAGKIHRLDALGADMRKAIDTDPTDVPARYLVGVFRPWLALYRQDPEFARLFLSQSTLNDGPWTRHFLDVCAQLETNAARAVDRLLGEGALRPELDPATVTQGVLAFYYHMIVGHSLGALPDAAAQERLFDALIDTWMTGCRPAAGP
ncbi:TetR/AcrR family transcriptional regulator [Stappia sp. ES.058]|uniref:TetR/AcrR family transcriptional regulator n=1 Tax=Stappia sp. ES.058 TaxID=1881061 RepID=UPI00087ABC80|nr:TetR/AcrR family transcriptional regulator [Stappia sp. ES.058]SDU38131.1 transcriptional regulator, TetR family [Stappia sp. ES.058]